MENNQIDSKSIPASNNAINYHNSVAEDSGYSDSCASSLGNFNSSNIQENIKIANHLDDKTNNSANYFLIENLNRLNQPFDQLVTEYNLVNRDKQQTKNDCIEQFGQTFLNSKTDESVKDLDHQANYHQLEKIRNESNSQANETENLKVDQQSLQNQIEYEQLPDQTQPNYIMQSNLEDNNYQEAYNVQSPLVQSVLDTMDVYYPNEVLSLDYSNVDRNLDSSYGQMLDKQYYSNSKSTMITMGEEPLYNTFTQTNLIPGDDYVVTFLN